MEYTRAKITSLKNHEQAGIHPGRIHSLLIEFYSVQRYFFRFPIISRSDFKSASAAAASPNTVNKHRSIYIGYNFAGWAITQKRM